MKEKIIDNLIKAARSPEGFFAVVFILSELIISLSRFELSMAYLLNKIFFAAIAGFTVGVILSLIPKKAGRVIGVCCSVLFTLYLLVQLIYSSVFKNFWSLSATGSVAGQAFDYKTTILKAVRREIVPFLLIILLGILVIVAVIKWIDLSIHHWEKYLLNIFILAGAIIYFMLLLQAEGDDWDSPATLMKEYSSVEQSVEKLGIVETMLRDGLYMVFEKNSTVDGNADTAFETVTATTVATTSAKTATETSAVATTSATVATSTDAAPSASVTESEGLSDLAPIAYVPNKPDYDLSKIIENTSNSSVIELTQYINSVQPTFTNDYTGMFEGYNLIFIVAEGFDGFVIDSELTPELYKMSHNGFYFMNFYTPLWYGSTLGGEYGNLTGLMPKNSGYLSMQKMAAQGNSMPFCLGNELADIGYNVYSFHNNYYTYYDRHRSRKYLGYENYIGIGNGLEYEKNSSGGVMWPQSDYFMEQNTFDDFSGSEPFHVYYLTTSGHLEYDFGGNAMSKKNKEAVDGLYYSETTRAYIACQLEFEKMVEALNEDLENAGLADNTLIVICGDHVPYDNMNIPVELSRDGLDSFDLYKNSLIIYSASMKRPVRVEKVCYSLDILPTVLNLMGLPYDSRMLAGRDIMSDEPGLVIMPDGSFITDNYKYNAVTRSVTAGKYYSVGDEELANQKSEVSNRIRLSNAICELNYYSYVEELLKPEEEE